MLYPMSVVLLVELATGLLDVRAIERMRFICIVVCGPSI